MKIGISKPETCHLTHMCSKAYSSRVSWAILLHPEVADWVDSLGEADYQQVLAVLDALAVDGPALGRPFVDTIKGSRYPNMKELRPRGGALRMLFAFDPERQAVVLVAGDKSNRWTQWYRENVPIADDRFEAHGQTLSAGSKAGRKSGRSRKR